MIEVVCAIIINNDKVLIAKRNLKKSYGGYWEFPGGKLEENETLEKALIREIKEELDMNIEIIAYFDESILNNKIKLTAFTCKMLDNHFKVLEHEEVKFVDINKLDKYNFAQADIKFVEKLINTEIKILKH